MFLSWLAPHRPRKRPWRGGDRVFRRGLLSSLGCVLALWLGFQQTIAWNLPQPQDSHSHRSCHHASPLHPSLGTQDGHPSEASALGPPPRTLAPQPLFRSSHEVLCQCAASGLQNLTLGLFRLPLAIHQGHLDLPPPPSATLAFLPQPPLSLAPKQSPPLQTFLR